MNLRTSSTLVGVAQSLTAVILHGSGDIPEHMTQIQQSYMALTTCEAKIS